MLGNSCHSPWYDAVPKRCGWVVIWKPVCFNICVFLPGSTITALCVSLEGAVSAVTGAHKGQHPACLHSFGACSSREMPCPHFHPPTSSTGQLCTVCAAQKCVLQALTVEGRNGWLWANMPWMSSNALSAVHFFYSSMMALFNYSTCLLKNGSNHKSRSPKERSIYSMSLLIRGKSSVESEVCTDNSHFYRTRRIFWYCSLRQEICFLQTSFNTAKYFSWSREWQKLDRDSEITVAPTILEQTRTLTKCWSWFLFRIAAVGKQLTVSVQWVETSSREPKSRIEARTRRGNTEE